MGYSKVYVHLVWTTHKRNKVLREEFRNYLFAHIKANAKSKGIFIDHINGYLDHLHCLVVLHPDQSIAKVVQLLKGESSYWINRSGYVKSKFKWQEEYYVVSVGMSQVNMVRNYIRNQETHHRSKGLERELSTLAKKLVKY